MFGLTDARHVMSMVYHVCCNQFLCIACDKLLYTGNGISIYTCHDLGAAICEICR